METVTRPHAQNLVRFAATRPEVLVLSADLTASCEADDFRDAYPDRFFSLGMAEQNLMGFAAGLAREGFRPFVHTFGVFVTRRPFDQVAMSIAYPCLPVRLLGFLPGITTPGGATHQATDDLAVMRALPNMTILECGDATEVESVLEVADAVPGPVYVRMLRGEIPRLFDTPMVLGQSRSCRSPTGGPHDEAARGHDLLASGPHDEAARAHDLLVVSSGICTEEALRAVAAMRRRGVAVHHLHVSTLKPFGDDALRAAILTTRRGVITVENHSVIGGLGSATAEVMAEMGSGTRLRRLGLQDTFAHGASRAYLMRRFGLDAQAVVRAAVELLGHDLEIGDQELAAEELGPERLRAQAENL